MKIKKEKIIQYLEQKIKSAQQNRLVKTDIQDIDEGLILLDHSFKVEKANGTALNLLKQKEKDLAGKIFYSLLDRVSFAEGIKLFDHIQLGKNYSGNFAFHNRESSFIPLNVSVNISEHGFYYCLLEKIDQFIPVPPEPPVNLGEESNLYINETFKALIKNSPAAVLILDMNSNVLVWNKVAEEIYGLKSRDVIGRLLPTLTEESFPEHLEIRKKLLSGNTIADYDVERKKKDGSVLWLNMSISPVKDNTGNIFATMSIVTDITRRKLAEARLKKTEILYHDVVETAQDLIWRCDTDYRFTYMNPAWEKVTGFSLSAMLGKNFCDYLKNDQKTSVSEKFNILITDSSIQRFETVILDKNHEEHYLYLHAKRITDESGKVSGLCGTAYDITDKKKAEQSLRENEEILRSIYENSTIGIYRTTPEGKILMLNAAGLKMLGYTSFEEISGRNLNYEGFEPSYPRKQFMDMLHKNGTVIGFENAWIKKDGNVIYIRESAKAVKDDSGKIVCYDGTFEDITAKKLAEDSVRESEERLKLAQQIGAIGSWEINLETGETNCSDEMYEIFDEKFVPCTEFYMQKVHPEDKNPVEKAIKDAIQKGTPYQLDHRVVLSGGKMKYLHSRSRIIRNTAGQPIRLVNVVQDITERKKYEAELKDARIKAEESNKLKTSFLQNMSHEIRTPMNGILGFTQLLLEPDISNDEMKFYVQTINNSCTNLLNIINDVVEISKIETGIVQVYKSVFNLNHLLDELYDFFSYEATQKNIVLKVEKGSFGASGMICSDEQKIRQILTNLIKNAMKFTHKGMIRFGYKFQENDILFTIEDTGIGIDKKFHSVIFERFRQAETGDTKIYGGTGLGLAICKSLVEILGGTIGVESEPGAGSRFFFTLPNETARSDSQSKNKEEKKSDIPDFSSRTLLLAEDDDANYYFMHSILSKTKAEIIHAVNGLQAVELIKSHPDTDIILMDIKMPVMDGLEATREIRRMGIGIPIVAVTAYAMKEERQLSFEAGCNDYITKPVQIDELFKKMLKHLKKD